MRFLLLPVTAALLCFLSPARGGEPDHQAEVQVEIILSEGETPVAKAALHTDLQSGGSDFEGVATLKLPDGGCWIVNLSGSWREANPEVGNPALGELQVRVSDTSLIKELVHEGSKSVWPLEIFEAVRRWSGPGSYRVGEQDGRVLTILFRETPALSKKSIPASAPEKK